MPAIYFTNHNVVYILFQTFVYGNNLFHQPDPFNTPSAVTGSQDSDIYNGIADWLYEGEQNIIIEISHRKITYMYK